jgi:hypothetical protein
MVEIGTGQAQAGIGLVRLQTAASALGDLSRFRAIAADTLKITRTGDLPAAKTRIKDLETAWDDAEAQMRPLDKDAWRTIDKAIDLALTNLRAASPNDAACAAALQALIATMDGVAKPG